MDILHSATQRMDKERQFLESLFNARFNAYLLSVGLFSVSLTSSDTAWTGRPWFLAVGMGVSAVMSLTLWRTHVLITRALNIILIDHQHPYYIVTRKWFFPSFRANSIMLTIPILLTLVFLILYIWSIVFCPARLDHIASRY